MSTLYYLAYGSNLHPGRLNERVPSAREIGIVELPGKTVNFLKRSQDKSGKCNLIADPKFTAYGVLYEMLSTEKAELDRAEGLGRGYSEAHLQISVNSKTYQAFSYLADPHYISQDVVPYDWYKAMVIAGAKYHRFPSTYVEFLSQARCIPDPNIDRAAKNEILVSKLTKSMKAEKDSSEDDSLAGIARGAYGSVSSVVGILLAAISLFNLALHAWRLEPVPFFAALVAGYRSVFHPIVEVAFMWSPWRLSPSFKDGAVVWALLGTTALRWIQAVNLNQAPNFRPAWLIKTVHRIYLGIMCVVFGPLLIVAFLFLKEPHQMFDKLFIHRAHRVQFPAIRLLQGLKEPPYNKRHDLLVLIVTVLSSLFACACLVALNGFYGPPFTG